MNFRYDDDSDDDYGSGGAWRGGGVLFWFLRLHITWTIRKPSQLLLSLQSYLPSTL